MVARILERLGNRIDAGAAHSAGNADRVPEIFYFCGVPQRADHIQDFIANLQVLQHHCGLAHHLENNGDDSGARVLLKHRERDALPVFIDAQDYELPGLVLFRNLRSRNLYPVNARRNQISFSEFYCP